MRLARVLAVALLAGTLAGCTAPEPVSPSPSALPPTATPTPTPIVEPSTIRLTSATLDIVMDDGTVQQSFGYFSPVQPVVEALTTVFGTEPLIDEVHPHEGYPFTRYDWSGFALNDSTQVSDGVFYTEYRIAAAVESVAGIVVETGEGVRVGDDIEQLAATYPEISERIDSSSGARVMLRFDEVPLPQWGDGSEGTFEFWVSVRGSAGGVVDGIYAPSGGGPGY